MPTSQETVMMCIIDGELFFTFLKHKQIGDSGVSCYITNNDTEIHDVADISKSVQGFLDNLKATKKGNLYIMVRQVDRSGILLTMAYEVF